MNVYDFDKTIYDGDSTIDFYLFSLKRKPSLLKYFPIQIYGFIRYIFGNYTKLQFKEKFYSFLKGLDNIDHMINVFWNEKQFKIKEWYLFNKRDSDLVISASPEFLLKPICKKIGIEKLIASKVNKYTGICEAENCYGEEKVIELKKQFPNVKIESFYSDSLSDEPLSKIAKKSYIVSQTKIIEWGKYNPSKLKKIKTILLTKQFIKFLFIGCINTITGILFSSIYSIFLDVNISFIIGYLSSMLISYILNSSFVFEEQLSFNKFIKFFISYIPNFIIQNIMVFLFYNIFTWNKLIVFALAAVIGVPITFILMKVFTFRKRD
ncbi:polysaccharide biosynthesis protein GtrA [Clostridium beijerinckii]|nr:polysaccharide biosynthesis protein GtrA [Clostridium beijerinckii]